MDLRELVTERHLPRSAPLTMGENQIVFNSNRVVIAWYISECSAATRYASLRGVILDLWDPL